MGVCRFFMQGTCKFGSNCKFEHPGGGQSQYKWVNQNQQRNVFGSQNRYEVLNSKDGSKDDNAILAVVSQDMADWMQSGMWPLSCYGMKDSLHCVQGLDDISPEEMRFQFLQIVKENGDINQFSQKVLEIVTRMGDQKQIYRHPSQDTRKPILEELKKSADVSSNTSGGSQNFFGKSGQSSSSIFGGTTSQPTQASQSPFLGSPQPASGNSNPFASGQSGGLFGKGDTTSNSVFGTGQTGGLFGKSPGGTASGLFGGGTSSGSGNLFGSNQGQSAGLFGKGPESGSAGLFGKGPESGSAGLFGKGPELGSAGLFGKGPESGSAGLFGKSTESGSAGLFGKGPETSGAGLFGKSPVVTGQSPGLFGGNANTASTGLFGKPAAFGAAQPSVFGQNTQQGTPFQSNALGQSSVLSGAAGSVQLPGAGGDGQSTEKLYTPLDQLTAEEKEQFSAQVFTLGKIPIRPPPKEMVK